MKLLLFLFFPFCLFGQDYSQIDTAFYEKLSAELIEEGDSILMNKRDFRLSSRVLPNSPYYILVTTIAKYLKEKNNFVVEIGSHTDCQGRTQYNDGVSQRRAQSIEDALIARGINRSRLTAVGYGERYPLSDCKCKNCSEDIHNVNHRISIKLITKTKAP